MLQYGRRNLSAPMFEDDRQSLLLHLLDWQQRLNLNDWDVYVGDKPAVRAAADITFDAEARAACIRLGTDLGGWPPGGATIRDLALHELLHLRLHDLIAVCRKPDATEEEINAVEHSTIHALLKPLTEGHQ